MYRLRFIFVILIVLLFVGCGSEGESTDQEAVTEEPIAELATESTEAPTEEPTPEPTEEVSAATTDVKSATIYIEAEGTFTDVEGNPVEEAGTGSGFIIDESGIAVTNNHVVTGAAFLNVRVSGEEEARQAVVLGASECSDLAVIDIEGEGFPFLGWYEGEIAPPLEVLTAGFPLGDPEFTMTKGIVSKAKADGKTAWASIESVIEHDATINPGNSGGPLVTSDSQVVGVNYASNAETSQFFAIPSAEAQRIIEQLREKQDIESIGINGQAFITELDSGELFSGIVIWSVKSGSPASKAGIKGGDILFELEGLTLADDGTMTDYCNILRAHDPEDALTFKVLRLQTEQCLGGELNGREAKPIDCSSGLEVPDEPEQPVVKKVSTPTPTPSPTPKPKATQKPLPTKAPSSSQSQPPQQPSGPQSFTLWGHPLQGSIGAGQDRWFKFDSNQETEATLIAFMQNVEQVEIYIFHGNEIPVFPHHDPDHIPNVGTATQQGNRDQNDNTKEFVWQGPIEKNALYYVRFINRGNKTVQYCVITRPDKYSCP